MLKTISRPGLAVIRNNGEYNLAFHSFILNKQQFIHILILVRGMSSKTFETLAVSQPAPFVKHVQLNRPDKFNAFNTALWR